MTQLKDIHDWLCDEAGHPLHGDEGTTFGDPSRPVTSVGVCWVAGPEQIGAAAERGCDLLVHHESLLYPYPSDGKYPHGALAWPTNRQRIEALTRSRMLTTRLHGTLDELYIYDRFAQSLGLTRVAAEGGRCRRVFEIDPTPYARLIEHVKAVTGLNGVRATSIQPGRVVRYVGMPWGGLGLFVNVAYQQSLLDLGVPIDVMIAGETDNYGFRFVAELGIDVIETSHEVSEDEGLADFAAALDERFGDVRVEHVPTPCVWRAW